ncbi:MAG: ArsA family ATPase [Bradymonadia bacterium]
MPSSAPTLAPLLDRRFTVITGKGGVGKSTVTALLGQRAAAAGHRTLICELNTQERVAPMFGRPPSGSEITAIVPNLYSVNIEPRAAMEEYALMKLKIRAIYRLVFENPLVQRFVRFIPGMNDLLMLGKAFNHERERTRSGRPVWDRIIIDAPATGHGISLLRLPRIIRDAVPAGNMHNEAAAMWNLVTDPERTAVHLVCLPEELPVQETRQLHDALVDQLGVPMGALFLNMVPPPLLDDGTRVLFETLSPPDDDTARTLWDLTTVRQKREALAAGYGAQLESLGMPLVQLPTQYSPQFGPKELTRLGQALDQQALGQQPGEVPA